LSTNSTNNGECATYDAFGRMVEFSKNSTYKENWYTQAGPVVMSGTTLGEAYLGAPGLQDTKSLRRPDPAYADILLDQDGNLRQPDNRPLLRRFNDGLFVMS
jgi:hypothetical protein